MLKYFKGYNRKILSDYFEIKQRIFGIWSMGHDLFSLPILTKLVIYSFAIPFSIRSSFFRERQPN